LWGTSDEIQLTVSDSGLSFDTEATKASRELGLISMSQRLENAERNIFHRVGTPVHLEYKDGS
jgi:signal transduction histidine kinase